MLAVALLLLSLKSVAQNETQAKAIYPRLAKAQAYEAKGFHALDCFAGQVRIHGKRLSRQSFTVFRSEKDKCCGDKVGVGRTDTHGHFLLEPLGEGEYFAAFNSKGTQYTVGFAVIEGYQRCDGTHAELNFKAANQCSLRTYTNVDYSERDCSEDDPACYRK